MARDRKDICEVCGYTKKDADYNLDHHLCKNYGNAPWEQRPLSPPGASFPRDRTDEWEERQDAGRQAGRPLSPPGEATEPNCSTLTGPEKHLPDCPYNRVPAAPARETRSSKAADPAPEPEHVCKPSCNNPCLLDEDRRVASSAPTGACEELHFADPRRSAFSVTRGVSPAGQAGAQDTRFSDFDDADHPFRIWWGKHGQYMMSGGGRRESIWAARGWIAREQLLRGVEVTGESMREAAPSGEADDDA